MLLSNIIICVSEIQHHTTSKYRNVPLEQKNNSMFAVLVDKLHTGQDVYTALNIVDCVCRQAKLVRRDELVRKKFTTI